MVTEALQKHHVAQLEELARAKDAWQDLDLVFCNQIGQPLSRHTFQKYSWFGKMLRAAKLPPPFDFMICATQLLRSFWHEG
jgi:hypothetical protein